MQHAVLLTHVITDDTIHCVYIAPSESHHHAEQAGFPANGTMEVRAVIDPTTAEV